MPKKFEPTPELLEGILLRIPEGIIRRSALNKRVKMYKKSMTDRLLSSTRVVRDGTLLYDASRLSQEEARELDKWCLPSMPKITDDGFLVERPIIERRRERDYQLAESDAEHHVRLVRTIDDSPGYMRIEDLCQQPDDHTVLKELTEAGVLGIAGEFVFDPLRLSQGTMSEMAHQAKLSAQRQEIVRYLEAKPGQTAPRSELVQQFGKQARQLVNGTEFALFQVTRKINAQPEYWVRLRETDAKAAHKVAREAVRIKDEAWEPALELCGDVVRTGARDGKTRRIRVIARTYTIDRAANRLGMQKHTIERAIKEKRLPAFEDPEGRIRIPAHEIESAYTDPDCEAKITAPEPLTLREVADVIGISPPTVRRRLQKVGISRGNPRWGDVRQHLDGVPPSLREFRQIAKEKRAERRAQRAAARAEAERRRLEEIERERQRIADLRARLVAAFPTWQHEGRSEQRITLHIGPPNSGKTHDALTVLMNAGVGWYLAPLRLLAFEIFDRLNRQGVLCNLLTGEEHIDVPGARITAATIEMFNANSSGECVVIDEAQMLADSDRGWAWTRALMEAQAPEIHVIGPETARNLIMQLASSAAIPLEIVEHERLAPIKVAERSWPLDQLPSRTILVAFSRRMVLHLKTVLEQLGRTVSVVYGSLPPEVRRRQADRFAEGETDICVATDAVGMGLNLPADYVCFYEVEKYDGKEIRQLKAAEVQQIGGRAGRFGLGMAGEVGATNRRNLKVIERLFYEEPDVLTHAHVAPSVEDLEMIPGSLWQRLVQWSNLQSIPDSLRNVIDTANLAERIELARMLTDAEVNQLGLESALRLVNAPTRQASRAYWYSCAQSILKGVPMPMPPSPPARISTGVALEDIEICISCADNYLWLANRHEFKLQALDVREVAQLRLKWSMQIDAALLRRIDTSRRCKSCGKKLPPGHRYGICDECYTQRYEYSRYS